MERLTHDFFVTMLINIITLKSNACSSRCCCWSYFNGCACLGMVAYGRLHDLSSTIHHRKMNDAEVRVAVVRVLIGDAQVPYQTDEVTTVGEAPGQFIAWPRRLVESVTNKGISQRKEMDPKFPSQSKSTDVLKTMWIAAVDINEPISIQMEAGIVWEDRNDIILIESRDIMGLLQTQKLVVPVIQFYNKYLYNILKSSGKSNKYGLMCPRTIQVPGDAKQGLSLYIRTRIVEGDFECFLAPILCENHWQLMVLFPKKNVVALFCSMRKKPKKQWIEIIETAFEVYKVMKGTHTPNLNPNLKKSTWVFPNCHKQRGWEAEACGYFVMRYMLEIIRLDIVDSFEKKFNIEDPYSKEEIDDIRRRWTHYFLEVTSLA